MQTEPRSTLLRPFALLAPLVLATGAGAQSVLVVDDDGGPGVDFTDFGEALEAAQPNDTLLMRAGDYFSLTEPVYITDKPLRILADGPGEVRIREALTITGLDASERFVIRGITFNDGLPFSNPSSLRVINNAGKVWIEDSELSAGGGGGAGGFVIGLQVQASTVVAVRCEMYGNILTSSGVPGVAVDVFAGNLLMYDCNLYGGRFLGQDGAPGLRVDSNSDVFASGCYIEGGSGFEGKLFFCSGDGGAGVAVMSAVSNVDLLDTQTVGGAAGPNDPCGTAVDGPGISAPVGNVQLLNGAARHYSATSLVPAGAPAVSSFDGEPGDVAILILSGVYDTLELPVPIGPLLVGGTQAVANIGTLPTGSIDLTFTGPPLPGLSFLPVYLQGAFIAGPDLFLGPGSAQTLLP